LAYGCGRIAPGGIEFTGLAAAETVLGKRFRHALTVIGIGARHRPQILHRDMSGDLAAADALLHRFGKLFHQSQSARHPAHTAIEAPSQIFQAVAETLLQFLKQPPLFQCGLLFGKTHRTIQHQSVSFVHVPDDGLHRVPAQLLQSCDAFVTVDDQISVRQGNDDDRRLLSRCRQRRQQSPLPFRTPRSQMLIAAVELVKLQLHSAFPLRRSTLVQAASGIAWTRREVCLQALNLQ
jgi:hypothetical protein